MGKKSKMILKKINPNNKTATPDPIKPNASHSNGVGSDIIQHRPIEFPIQPCAADKAYTLSTTETLQNGDKTTKKYPKKHGLVKKAGIGIAALLLLYALSDVGSTINRHYNHFVNRWTDKITCCLPMHKKTEADQYVDSFPDEMPRTREVLKYREPGSKYCLVHIRNQHYDSISNEKMKPIIANYISDKLSHIDKEACKGFEENYAIDNKILLLNDDRDNIYLKCGTMFKALGRDDNLIKFSEPIGNLETVLVQEDSGSIIYTLIKRNLVKNFFKEGWTVEGGDAEITAYIDKMTFEYYELREMLRKLPNTPEKWVGRV